MPSNQENRRDGEQQEPEPFILLRAQALDPNAPKLHSRYMIRNWIAVLYAIFALASNAYDASLGWNLSLLNTFKQDVVGGDAYSLASIDVANSIGAFLAPFTYMPLFDGFGRRRGVVIGTIFAFIGVCVQVFGTFGANPNIAFLSGRVINQFGIAIAGAVANAYVMEISHPAWRGFFGGLFGGVWVWGMYLNQFVILIASLTPETHWQWRVPIMIQFVWVIIIVAMSFYVPETPRWLVHMGREEEARQVIIKWQANDDTTNPMIEAQMEELRELVATAPKFTYLGSINPFPLFANPNVRRRMLIITITTWGWKLINLAPAGGVFTTLIYDLIGINNPTVKQGLDIGGDIFSVVGGYFGSFGPERYGRRKLQLWGYGGAAIFSLLMAIFYQLFASNQSVIGFGVAFFASKYILGLWNAMVTAPSANLFFDEIMPYEHRMRTLFVQQVVSSAMGFGIPYLQAFIFTFLGDYNFYWVFGYSVIQAITIYLLVPETKGRTLEQVGEIFDHHKFVTHSLKILKLNDELDHDPDMQVKVKA
ncbi:hypothetical protein BJ742DRAFT_849145 [Cladochytrium replicatum]|nr:hypothetical protein BJ742DRAFT_849145 [Cladochytrium replicatum]